jgi:predicted amidophosphoribosyltransferase
MPFCAQCGAGVDGFSRRCHACKRDPFPPSVTMARCPVCESTFDPDLMKCPDCEGDVDLEIYEEAQ